MNIIEAIKSGKNIRRKVDACFRSPKVWEVKVHAGIITYHFDKEDLLADDWEVEEEKIPITLSDVADAYAMGLRHAETFRSISRRDGREEMEYTALLRRLGFVE